MIYFRVDMNSTIATGHVMRCLAIAEAAKVKNEDATFIVADDNAKKFIESKGFNVYVLHNPWNELEKELDLIIPYIRKNNVEHILVDTYQVTHSYLKTLNQETRVTYLDDLCMFQYPVDSILCYAIYNEQFAYNCPHVYLGTKYFPARSSFSNLPKKDIHVDISRVLVISGGTDRYNTIERIIDTLSNHSELKIDAVCGVLNPSFGRLQTKYKHLDRIHIHRSISDIENYMINADIVFSAGGTTLYELCACGVPTITYSIADNQLMNVKGFETNGIMQYLGDARYSADFEQNVTKIFERYRSCYYRTLLSEKMKRVVDGKGAGRIVSDVFGVI